MTISYGVTINEQRRGFRVFDVIVDLCKLLGGFNQSPSDDDKIYQGFNVT